MRIQAILLEVPIEAFYLGAVGRLALPAEHEFIGSLQAQVKLLLQTLQVLRKGRPRHLHYENP